MKLLKELNKTTASAISKRRKSAVVIWSHY